MTPHNNTNNNHEYRADVFDADFNKQVAEHSASIARALGEHFLCSKHELRFAAAAHVDDEVGHHRKVVGIAAPYKHQVRHADHTQKPMSQSLYSECDRTRSRITPNQTQKTPGQTQMYVSKSP
jgi:hypothetical protein